MKNIFLFTLILFVLSCCDTMSPKSATDTYQDDFNALERVDTTDGINQSEAYIIAKVFFWLKISGCGFPDEPISKNGFWESKTHIGYSGVPGESIFINKENGTITWGDKTKAITLEELKEATSN